MRARIRGDFKKAAPPTEARHRDQAAVIQGPSTNGSRLHAGLQRKGILTAAATAGPASSPRSLPGSEPCTSCACSGVATFRSRSPETGS